MYIVIRAGGVGTRLWPVSRQAKPKQLHALTGDKTLLQEAVDRVSGVVAEDHIYISCNQEAAGGLQQSVGIASERLIIEPSTRDTAAAIGLETIMIAQRDPQAIIASLGSDHIITNTAEFQRILRLAEATIQQHPDHIACIGITPKQPDTGYGYIELGEALAPEVFKVNSFKEKPDLATAEQFLHSGQYLWNGNMFVWRADTLLALYKQFMPAMYQQLLEMQQDFSKVGEIYQRIEKIAIDYAIIERAPHILAIPGNFGWNDIGDWARLKDEVAPDEADNYTNIEIVQLDTKNTLVYSETKRVIATIGLKNIVIVDTPDALLVCRKSRSQDVKHIVELLKKNQHTEVL